MTRRSSRFRRRLQVLLTALIGSVPFVVSVPPAFAGVGLSVVPNYPSSTTVGQTGVPASVDITNASDGAEATGNVTISNITLITTCGTFNLDCPASAADPGVFQPSATAVGNFGSACAGTTFTLTNIDPTLDEYLFAPSAPVVLGPPLSPNGGSRCTILFTFTVLKTPTKDAQPAVPGLQTVGVARAFGTHTSGLVGAGRGLDSIMVLPPASSSAPADFDGNGTSDKAVYRPSTGQWFVAGGSPALVQYGASGDIPVPANYDGAGGSDIAVYRPSTGQWFVRGGSPEVTTFGGPGDIPVPADYNGNGTADKAVFRPSTGQWFVAGGSPAVTTYGSGGDIPVPADYDGNGTIDKAVYRPSTGQWFVAGGSPELTSFGAGGDIPVPGRYDGVGGADKAVYRPSTGQWFVNAGSPPVTVYGAAGDQPQPGDFDGNASTDKAVFRPSSGTWFVSGGSPEVTVYGTGTDIPLVLPHAIRRVFFP
ncbi:MAG: hypothetical protein ACR2MO_15460 [Acidimicrobiales bacterium]